MNNIFHQLDNCVQLQTFVTKGHLGFATVLFVSAQFTVRQIGCLILMQDIGYHHFIM